MADEKDVVFSHVLGGLWREAELQIKILACGSHSGHAQTANDLRFDKKLSARYGETVDPISV